MEAHLNVPEAFCVTTIAYRRFLAAHNLEDKIANILGDTDIDNLDQLETRSRRIREFFVTAEMPPDIAEDIKAAYVILRHSPVAVRSSATSEDLPEASFAGQQESYLNVIGDAHLLESIKQCWASLWTPRSINYRARQGIDNSSVSMAVLVQEMIPAEVAGVMFTANPLKKDSSEIVINASYGLGEAIVSGSITPDMFIMDKQSLRILKYEIQSKEVMAVSNHQGGIEISQVGSKKKNISSLSEADIAKLGMLGKRVEEVFSSSQDIEWAYSHEQFFLLQSRPITSRQAVKDSRSLRYNRIQKLILGFLFDYFPIPPYHFDRSLLLGLIDKGFQYGEAFGLAAPKAADVCRIEPDGSLRLHPILPRLTWRTLPIFIRGVVRALQSLRQDPNIWAEERFPRIAQHIDSLQKRDVVCMTDEEVLAFVQQAMSIRDDEIVDARMDYFFGGWIAMGTLPFVLRVINGKQSGELYYKLLSGLDHPTASMNNQLRKLTRLASSLPDVHIIFERAVSSTTWSELEATAQGAIFLQEVRLFLDRFGARTETLIATPSIPAWEDKPNTVLSLVAGMLNESKSLRDNPAESQDHQFEETYTYVLKSAKNFPFRVLGIHRLLGFLIPKCRAMVRERDWVIFGYDLSARPLRRGMQEIARRLVERGILAELNDVRFLSLEEAYVSLIHQQTTHYINQIRLIVRQRKLARVNTLASWKPPVSIQADVKAGDVILQGTAASPGIVSGTARVILSEDEFSKLKAGELLVCRSTNPAWTPLFSIASGVVADVGGPLSHAAIVAREYGIPAVLGTQHATSLMMNDEIYTVDGTNGKVRRAKLIGEEIALSRGA